MLHGEGMTGTIISVALNHSVMCSYISNYTMPSQQNSLVIPPLDKKYPGYTTVRPLDARCQSDTYIHCKTLHSYVLQFIVDFRQSARIQYCLSFDLIGFLP